MSKNIIQKMSIIFSIVVFFGGSLTFVMTWRNIGFSDGFIISWLSSFTLSVLFIAPIGGVIAVALDKVLSILLDNLNEVKRNITFGLCMAVIMESIMATITTINLHGFVGIEKFINLWAGSFIAALPLGIVFSIIITLIIKPKLKAFWAK